eukprot:1640349-Rhodomonas_salina.3
MKHASSNWRILLNPLLLTAFLALCGGFWNPDSATSIALPPPYVVVEEGRAVDLALNWTSPVVDETHGECQQALFPVVVLKMGLLPLFPSTSLF